MKKPAKKPKRKPRRVVLGIGWPWFVRDQNYGRTHVCLTRYPGDGIADVVLKFGNLGHYNKIRLVAEVLK